MEGVRWRAGGAVLKKPQQLQWEAQSEIKISISVLVTWAFLIFVPHGSSSVSLSLSLCPAAEGRGAFDIVRENVTRSVCLCFSLYLSGRELPNANSEPIELGMVLNEGEDRKTLLRRGGTRRRCVVFEI